MHEHLTLVLCLMGVAGLLIGFVSALLGIGGGMLMVPALFYLFGLLEAPEANRMHLAAGTSLLVMLATSVGSVWSHARTGNVVWRITIRVLPGIAVGVISGALLASILATDVLVTIFAVVLALVALLMVFGFKATPKQRPLPGALTATGIGGVIGFKSGLLGVGGGALSVPWLTWLGLPQHEVSGTSSTFTLPAAVVGSIAFLVSGFGEVELPLTVGYLFWPALPIAGGASILATSVGARLARRVPGRLLRIVFGLLLIGVSAGMLLG